MLLLSLTLAAAPVYGTKADDLSLIAMHNFGACVVRTTPAGAREVLALDYRTDAYQQKLRRLAKGHDRCTRPGTELQFNGVLFAGAMAEALAEEHKDGLAAIDQLKTPLAARDPLEALALCSVVTSPQEVAALLDAEVATDMEARAVQALEPTLNACLSGVDMAKLNRPALRSLLALAALRTVNAAATGEGVQ